MGVEEKDTNGGTLVTLSGGMADAVERARRAVVKANARRRWLSSGVVSAEGLVLTANHTVERDGDLSVEINEGRTFGGQLAGRDPCERSGAAQGRRPRFVGSRRADRRISPVCASVT
jgi:S1-C subfamily serine protease